MTSIPIRSADGQPREWNIGNRTLIVRADNKKALAVLNARYPLLLPPGSVLQFDGPPGELVVTRIHVIVGHDGGEAVAVQARRRPANTTRRRWPDPHRRGGSSLALMILPEGRRPEQRCRNLVDLDLGAEDDDGTAGGPGGRGSTGTGFLP